MGRRFSRSSYGSESTLDANAVVPVELDLPLALRLEIAALRRLHSIGIELHALTASPREKALADKALARAQHLTQELDVLRCDASAPTAEAANVE